MAIGEELFDKCVESLKEYALYTPAGAAMLHELSFLGKETTHYVVIVCCPIVVLLVKGERHHRRQYKAHREAAQLQQPQLQREIRREVALTE